MGGAVLGGRRSGRGGIRGEAVVGGAVLGGSGSGRAVLGGSGSGRAVLGGSGSGRAVLGGTTVMLYNKLLVLLNGNTRTAESTDQTKQDSVN